MLNTLLNKTKFTQIYSVEHELKKAAILRVFLGIIVFVRYLEIFYSISVYSPGMLLLQSIFLFIIIVLFTFGFFTPIVTLLLAITVQWFDHHAGTATLGTNILIVLLLVMFLMNHGLYGSIDSKIIQSKGHFSKVLKSIYNILGKPTTESIRIAYFIGFLFYAVTSFFALLLHIQDPYWVEGLTLYSALTNSYLFKFYELTRYLETMIPNLLFIISIVGIIFQSIFQFLMIPLIFFDIGRRFVITWGMIFFIISLIGINLSYLPHIEIIFWLLIFFPITATNKKISIIYDDYCNLCTNGMKFFKAINFNGKYEFIALSKNKDLYESKGLTEKEVRTYMVGWADGKQYIGYDLYIVMAKVNPLLWFILPLLYLGNIGSIGNKLYSFIAERRYKLFGVCSISSEDVIAKKIKIDFIKQSTLLLKFIQILSLIVLLGFIVIQNSLGVKQYIKPTIVKMINSTSYKFGLQIPNVFNVTDLSMGDHCMVIYRKSLKNNFELIPITALDGSRLTYENFDILNFTNHNSDFFYFGNTLKYRRHMINVTKDDLINFHENGYGYKNIKKRIQYDYKRKALSGNVTYKIEVYKNHSSLVEQWKTDIDRYEAKKIYSSLYTFDGKLLKKI